MKALFKTTIEIWTADPLDIDDIVTAANELLDGFDALGLVTKAECQKIENPEEHPDTEYFHELEKEEQLS